jgi:hypothetical protein
MSEANDLLGFELPEGAGEFDDAGEQQTAKRTNRNISIDEMTGKGSLDAWMNKTRGMTDLEAVDQAMVDKTYHSAVWYYRQAAMTGDLKATKALESWLTWAKTIRDKPKRKQAAKPSVGSAAFAPRGPRADEVEEKGEDDDES